MRISYWSSDVCSSDLCSRATCSRCRRSCRAPTSPSAPTAAPPAAAKWWRWATRSACACCPGNEPPGTRRRACRQNRSEEHTSELQSLMRISYAVFCLKKKTLTQTKQYTEYVIHHISAKLFNNNDGTVNVTIHSQHSTI